MDLLVVVHIKSSYDSWKAVFDADPAGREEFADDTRTRVAKVDDNTAMVQLFYLCWFYDGNIGLYY